MKKIILCAVAILAVSVAQAQVRFGVKAGLNISTLTGDVDVDPMVGAHVGGVVEFKFSEKFSLQPELLYSMQGAQNSPAEIHLDYLSVPIMAKYYIIKGLSVEAGPQIGVGVRYEDANGNDLELVHENFDIGLAVGAGYELPFKLFFQIRYYQGLMNVSIPSDYKNSVFALSVGYKFN